jgi:hypothetical protein
MAGEHLGKAYEAFLYNAAVKASAVQEVLWNPTLPSLMVQPDLVIGSEDAPRTIVMVTRSAARRGWDKKFWRNIGEVVDIRGAYPNARIVSITLGTEVKESLAEALGLFVDANVYPSREIREAVEEWLARVAASATGDRNDLADHIRNALPRAPANVRSVTQAIGAQIVAKGRDSAKRWRAASVWLVGRRGSSTSSDWKKPTSIRRGLSKLLVAGDPTRTLAAIDNKLTATTPIGSVFSAFGWATKSIAGWKVSDPEITGVLSAYPRDIIAAVLAECTGDELSAMCTDFSSVAWLNEIQRFLRCSASSLTDPNWLAPRLALCRSDPTLTGQLALNPGGLKGSWLFRALVALIKVAAQKKQAFGYEQLIGDVRALAPADRARVIDAGATPQGLKLAGTTDSLRRKLVDWVSGLAKAELAPWQILLVSIILARRIEMLSGSVSAAIAHLPDFIRRTTYEDRIAPYRFFEPIPALIMLYLNRAMVANRLDERHPTLVSDSSPSNRGAGTTAVLVLGSTLVHWKSAHDSHTSDKTKELCGRAFALKHRAGHGGIIVPAPGIRTLALVLDGDFSANDVSHLRRSGWDHIVGSQDIEKLVGQLVAET